MTLSQPVPRENPGRRLGGFGIVVGANRGIGLALTRGLLANGRVRRLLVTHRPGSERAELERLERESEGRLSRAVIDVTDRDAPLVTACELLDEIPDFVIHAAGMLHDGELQPEKSLDQCRSDHLLRLFEVNSIGPLRTAQVLAPVLDRRRPFTFAALSAMVGSIGDNRLGGWYGYRASKAALNQFVRTVANEWRHRLPRAVAVTIHPGTTDTSLSRPFQRNVNPGKLYSPERSAERILNVLDALTERDSGRFLNWDGRDIPW